MCNGQLVLKLTQGLHKAAAYPMYMCSLSSRDLVVVQVYGRCGNTTPGVVLLSALPAADQVVVMTASMQRFCVELFAGD